MVSKLVDVLCWVLAITILVLTAMLYLPFLLTKALVFLATGRKPTTKTKI